MAVPLQSILGFYSKMKLIREFDRLVKQEVERLQLTRYVHLSIGQESVAVGACSALSYGDRVVSTYRSHAVALALGADPEKLMAEILLAPNGYCAGRAGSMNVVIPEIGLIASESIVGAGIPLACGVAIGSQLDELPTVTLCLFGDGATTSGAFYEALNAAALGKLPVVFVCERNSYSISVPLSEIAANVSAATKAASMGIETTLIDGTDVRAVYDASRDAVAKCRSKGGPVLLECTTNLLEGHYVGAPPVPIPETAEDPVAKVADQYMRRGGTRAELDARDNAVRASLSFPIPSPASPTPGRSRDPHPAPPRRKPQDSSHRRVGPGPLTLREATNAGLVEAMDENDRVVMLGFNVAREPFLSRFGGSRVRNTAISENSTVGMAAGLMRAGYVPIVDLMMTSFGVLALEQILNRMVLGWEWLRPDLPRGTAVIRAMSGGGVGMGIHSSHTLHGWIAHFPGIRVIVPSSAEKAYRASRAAIAEGGVTLYCEHIPLIDMGPGLLSGESEAIDLSCCDVIRDGDHATIVGVGVSVPLALQAAATLQSAGISVSVIDPVCVSPLDIDTIVASVRRTKHLLVVDDEWPYGGFSAEVITSVVERVPEVRLSIRRLTRPAKPMLAAAQYVRDVSISAESIVHAVTELLGTRAASMGATSNSALLTPG